MTEKETCIHIWFYGGDKFDVFEKCDRCGLKKTMSDNDVISFVTKDAIRSDKPHVFVSRIFLKRVLHLLEEVRND